MLYFLRKQPLGLAKRKKEGERKKCCSVITMWTPGSRRDTPGFIGLGTLRGPCYGVCASVHHWIHQLQTHTHTRVLLKEPYQAMNSYPAGSPPPPQLLMLPRQRENKQKKVQGMPTRCSQVLLSLLPFFSSLHVSFRKAVRGLLLSLMTKGRHAREKLMYGSMLVYSAEIWWLWHEERAFFSPCSPSVEVFQQDSKYLVIKLRKYARWSTVKPLFLFLVPDFTSLIQPRR